MMQTITRKLEFDAGHRVLNHRGKCRHLHGHRYVAEITCKADDLDELNMVIDFSCVKEIVGGWVDQYWDHNVLFNSKDPMLGALDLLCMKSPFVFDNENPTAEVMARYLFRTARKLLANEPVAVTKIRIYETPNCWADYSDET